MIKINLIDSSLQLNSTTKNLRQQAETKLRNSANANPEKLSSEEVLKLVHELQIQHIELEMQNEELLKAQSELQYSQNRYFDLYDHAPVGYLTLDIKGLILETNFTAARLIGQAKSALIKKSLNQFIIPEHQDIFYHHCQKLLNVQEHNTCELRLLRSNNRQLDISLESTLVRDDTSAPFQILTTISDISKRKLAEKELQHSQSRLQAIINTALNAIITIDSQGTVLMFNKTAEDMFGYTAEEIIGQNVNRLMPSPYKEEHDGYLANYLKMHKAKVIGMEREVRGQRKDGTILPLSFSVGEFQDDNQQYFTGILQDISKRKQAEEIIQESEKRLGLAMDAIAAGFWDWDILTDQVFHNSMWFSLLGLKENAFAYSPSFFTALIHEDDRERVLRKLKQSLNGIGKFHSEHRLQHIDGHYIWVEENGIIVKRSNKGNPLRMVGSFIDISERKHHEQQQREHQNQYERLLKLEVASQTVAAIAHELNQPLNAAASYTDAAHRYLQKENIKEKKLAYAMDHAVQQNQRAGKVVHELFNFLHTGETITTRLGLNKVISDVMTTLKGDGYLGGFTTVLDLNPDLPQVRANSLQLEKVLINLIRNGIEAMHEAKVDQGSIVIKVSSAANSSNALVSICDSGPGLASENMQLIFEPFFSTKTDGLGMGLALSRALIEAQGGQLWCQTNEGSSEGATFHLTIPFA